jgi:peptidylprolyl isomerase
LPVHAAIAPEDQHVPTNQQRRDAERRRLQQQLQDRRDRETARKRATLIASIVGTVVLIAAVVIALVVTTGGSDNGNSPHGFGAGSGSGGPVSFDGVTVGNATDLTKAPTVTSQSNTVPTKLEYKDLVVGTGTPATPTSTVSVQYTGVLYKDGKKFDSSWDRGQPASFPLTQVVKGFTEGIGGNGDIPPMRVGGRRIMILPASLGYGAQATSGIPANSPIVFVVDLKSVSG